MDSQPHTARAILALVFPPRQLVLCLLMLAMTTLVMSRQVGDRFGFASGALRDDVIQRWGAPIRQVAPSVRFVESGAVFSGLEALPLASQDVRLEAQMSYRKRGLVRFSGFSFQFDGRYGIDNPHPHPIDWVFVLPIDPVAGRVLLSDLRLEVDGESRQARLDSGQRLVVAGRLDAGENLSLRVAFAGHGLESFSYILDPALPVRALSLDVVVIGGEGFDYPTGVLPAHEMDGDKASLRLGWKFDALESGIPIGLILPAEKSWDRLILEMARRSWIPFIGFLASIGLLAALADKPLDSARRLTLAAVIAFFYVLVPYLAAYMHFILAWILSLGLVGGLVVALLGERVDRRWQLIVWLAFLAVPSAAVIVEEHTGMIYTLEILAGLAVTVWAMGRGDLDRWILRLVPSAAALMIAAVMVLPAAASDAEATLPLDRVLELVRQGEAPPEIVEPPLAAALESVFLFGRVQGGRVFLAVEIELVQLADGWQRIPLLKLESGLHLTSLPSGERGAIVRDGDWLVFLGEAPGRIDLELSLVAEARVDGAMRGAIVELGPAALSRCRLVWDPNQIEMRGPFEVDGEAAWLPIVNDRLELAWRRLEDQEAPTEMRRRSVAEVVDHLQVSLVQTLEGVEHWRVGALLELDETTQLDIGIPEGAQLRRLTIDGQERAVELENGRIVIDLGLPENGNTTRLGLELVRRTEGFHLEGRLDLILPAFSWPVKRLELELFLPAVFDWRAIGGSLASSEIGELQLLRPAPTPGERLTFSQELLDRAAPTLRLTYDVRLDGEVFCLNPS